MCSTLKVLTFKLPLKMSGFSALDVDCVVEFKAPEEMSKRSMVAGQIHY